MSLKIEFYASIREHNGEEVNLSSYYQTQDGGSCIYSIKASEVCSEFISRYFNKVNTLPNLLLENVIRENYEIHEYERAKQDMYNGMYKADLPLMIQDNKNDFELKSFADSKIVRGKLLDKCEELYTGINDKLNVPSIDVYALFKL